jgi:hypothetical protein
MITSLIGGALVAVAFVAIALMRGGAAREPKPIWARGEAIESLAAVFLVTMIALGFALVVSSVGTGWIAPLLGLAIAVVGSVVAAMLAPRPRDSEPSRIRAETV